VESRGAQPLGPTAVEPGVLADLAALGVGLWAELATDQLGGLMEAGMASAGNLLAGSLCSAPPAWKRAMHASEGGSSKGSDGQQALRP
jgi:hypothetical protein